MPSENQPEQVGLPILTIYFKNRRDEDDKPLAGAQEVVNFAVEGGALVAQQPEGEIMIFPLAELEYASLTPQFVVGGSDVDGVSGSGEGTDEGEARVYVPNFGGGRGSGSEDEGVVDSDTPPSSD